MTNEAKNEPCRYCGAVHGLRCPMVKAMEFHPDGSVKRVEFVDGLRDRIPTIDDQLPVQPWPNYWRPYYGPNAAWVAPFSDNVSRSCDACREGGGCQCVLDAGKAIDQATNDAYGKTRGPVFIGGMARVW
ncbi:MAG: hypothetical protein KGL39_50810 [Patescibacteria group bacterium]|nr:hypothetical protein [Patescibacteria group bacterium]